MLNRIVLRAVRRVVGHADLDAQPAGQLLEVFLEQIHGRAVAAAAIAQHQQFLGLGIVGPALLVPPRCQAVTGQFAGVVAGVEVDEALVLPHIVETVGNKTNGTK